MSLGYIPPVPRLRLPARRGNPWIVGRWNDVSTDGHGGHGASRRGLILDLDDTFFPLSHDVTDVLHQLRASGWRLAALTRGVPSVQFRRVATLGLTLLVDEIIYAEEHAADGTPAPAAFKAALRSLELGAGQCVCVTDALGRDVRDARAIGIRTIRVARPAVPSAAADEADMVIDSLRHLPGAASLILDAVTADVA
jgi:FMN phosphatase YigB (HAD superfamily)